MADFTRDKKQLEAAIRSADGIAANELLGKICSRTLSREHRPEVALFAARIGQPLLGARLLHSRVRDENTASATPFERVVYAHCLARLGAIEEALPMLQLLAPSVTAARFFLASAHIGQWNYASAIPELQQYLASREVTEYQKLIARLNLAASLLFVGQAKLVIAPLRRIIQEARVRKLWLIEGNAHELLAQLFYEQQRWNDALRCLSHAEKLLGRMKTPDSFAVLKWKTFISLRADASTSPQDRDLAALRKMAQERHQDETIRDIDRFAGIRLNDSAALQRAWFGTPFRAFRAAIVRELGGTPELPRFYRWNPFGAGEASSQLDLKTGRLDDERTIRLKVGLAPHRLFSVLASDFYRAHRVATIASRLYPGEAFHPQYTVARVHEAMRRMRQWLDATHLPLDIVESNGAYRIQARKPFAILLEEDAAESQLSPVQKRLQAIFGAQKFSAPQAASALGLPARTVQRHLEGLTLQRKLQRTGKGKATRYGF